MDANMDGYYASRCRDGRLQDIVALCKHATTTMSMQTVARRSVSLPAFQGHRNCHWSATYDFQLMISSNYGPVL